MIGLETIRGALLDIDGTLLSNDRAIPGAAGALARLRLRGVALRLVTNTTRRPRAATAAVLRAAGFEVADEEVLAPASLARRRILASGRTRAALLVPPAARQDFDGVEEVQEGPAWVVVGDIGRDFTWDRLNQAFSWIKDGATLLALHKNRCWDPGIGRMVLDVGPFIAALEYATGKVAELVGKPSPDFFTLALEDLGLPAGDVLVVGDDLEADALGGATAGCRVAIVLSGKTTREDLDRATARPDLVVASVADLFP